MNVLVTGGAGFIGHHLILKLLAQGHECSFIDNRVTGATQQRARRELHLPNVPFSSHMIGDNMDCTDHYFRIYQPEAVIHLAGPASSRDMNEDSLASAGSEILELLLCAKKYKVKRFVYISSSMVYGNFSDSVTENSPTNPVSKYGQLKLACEDLVKSTCAFFNIEYNIIRPCSVYGIRDNVNRVVGKFFADAFNGKPLIVNGATETLDFTHVDDLTDGIIAVVTSKAYNETFNISRSRSRRLVDAAQLIISLVGNGSLKIENATYTRGKLNIDKAQEWLGFHPTIDIEQGFKECYEHF